MLDSTHPSEGDDGRDDEPSMYVQRPNSARSQDVTHILVRTFRELFTRDTIAPDVVQYLNISRCSDDEYHQQYVDALMKVQEEHSQRLAEFDMVERHIMQAQARAVSSDEREAHRLYAAVRDAHPTVYIPPVNNHFRSCINSELLKKHDLISPDDFSNARIPIVPPPEASDVPHYAQAIPSIWKPLPTPHKSTSANRKTLSANNKNRPHLQRQRSLPKIETLWKQQASVNDKDSIKTHLTKLQTRVNYLKNVHYIPPSSTCEPTARRTLVDADSGISRESNVKFRAVDCSQPEHIFVATPTAVKFTDYEPGLVYEMSVELTNISTVMRPLRVIPPQTPYFSVSLGQFPSYTSQVAPGLSCVYHIRFSPDALCDFDDVLIVESLSSTPLHISLLARRPPPVLTLPECLDVGQCLVGAMKVGRFTVKNEGGPGRFCLISTDEWPNPSFKSSTTMEALNFDEIFEVKPVIFQVTPEYPAKLDVTFAPRSCGHFSQQLTILCDNCNVRHVTIVGTGVTARVDLVSASECLLSSPVVGELCDITAQHYLRFPPLNPFTYTQRMITVKNCVDVELPYYWIFVKPDVIVHNPTETEVREASTERVQDVDTVFSIEPEAGILAPGMTAGFVLSFAPSQASQYHNALHMVLRYLQQPKLCREDEQSWAITSVLPAVGEPDIKEDTVLEIDVKGSCIPYDLVIEPNAFIIPGQISQDTVVKKKFKIYNRSLAPVWFTWNNVASWYVLHVEPTVGDIPAQTERVFDLSLSATQSGHIDEQLVCNFDCMSDFVSLLVKATVKCVQLTVDEADLDFGIICCGQSSTLSLTIRNADRIPLDWSIGESQAHRLSECDPEFQFCPSSGTLKPLSSMTIKVTFQPQMCRSMRSVLEIMIANGCSVVVSVLAEVQIPAVCLLNSTVDMTAYIDTPACQTVTLYNQTVFETSFCWGSPCGPGSEFIEVDMKPQSGQLKSREQLDVTITLVAHKLGKICGIFVPCVVDGMAHPLCLSLEVAVDGLSITYSVCKNPCGSDAWLTGDDIFMDFGCDTVVGTTSDYYFRIINNSAIAAPFCVTFDNFQASLTEGGPAITAHDNQCSYSMPLLKVTANLADTNAKTPSQAFADLCRRKLGRGLGIALDPCQTAGQLNAFGQVVIKVTAYCDMWGCYKDQLNCQIGDLEPIIVPVTITVVGCPLRFQMVSHDPRLSPTLRFGEAVDGADVISRRARILNTSSCDVRLDWQVFRAENDDKQLLDLITVYEEPFPLNTADSGSELSQVSPEIMKHLEMKRPKVVSLILREHEGDRTNEPFTVQPSQFVIPAHSSEHINVHFKAKLPNQDGYCPHSLECESFGLGYLTLEPCDLSVDGKVCRKHQYDIEPIRLAMTGTVQPAVVSMDCQDDDECFSFYAVASDLLMDCVTPQQQQQLKPVHMVVHGTTFTNKNAADVTFSLSCSAPFEMIMNDSNRVHDTTSIVLKSRQSVVIKLAFCLSPDFLPLSPPLEPLDGQTSVGRTLERTESETLIHLHGDLRMVYHNSSTHSVPLEAKLVIPVLKLSSHVADFGTCLVNQTRELEIVLTNGSRSSSAWKCSLETSSENCCETTFVVTPCSGMLDGQLSVCSKYKTDLHVGFTAHSAEDFYAVFIIDGILGEEPQRIDVRGRGTYDGHFEALVGV